MHDSRFYENEKKHEVAIYENKCARGRHKGKGYTIATPFFALLSILTPNDPTNINDIESLYLLDNLVNEVKLWRSSLTPQVHQESLPELFLNAQAYPSVRNVIQIILTLSATTVEAERSFSCMRQVKTWLSSPMTSDRLSDLCVLHYHQKST